MNYILASQGPQPRLQESNIDLYLYAARCLAEGNADLLLQAGLSVRDIPFLRRINLSELMAMSEQGANLTAYLRKARGDSQRNELALALMQQGAPRELMMSLFKMSTRRYSTERIRLGMSGLRGRPMTAQMEPSIEQAIWRLWVTLGNAERPGHMRNADDWLLIAREVPGCLRSAWSLIQRWSQSEEALGAFEGDRSRLTLGRLGERELELRRKHGLDSSEVQLRAVATGNADHLARRAA